MNHMYRYAYKWRDIGLALTFQVGELDNIYHTVATAQQCLTKLFDDWSHWPTWNQRVLGTVDPYISEYNGTGPSSDI